MQQYLANLPLRRRLGTVCTLSVRMKESVISAIFLAFTWEPKYCGAVGVLEEYMMLHIGRTVLLMFILLLHMLCY